MGLSVWVEGQPGDGPLVAGGADRNTGSYVQTRPAQGWCKPGASLAMSQPACWPRQPGVSWRMASSTQSSAPLPVIQAPPLPQVVPSRVCLTCAVCCRFPEAESFLRPYFTAEEIRRAVAAGLDSGYFPDPQGSQVRLVPIPSGDGYLCPAFDPATSRCRIYEARPLDCQIYPLALMWSADGSQVVLGWDSKCPFLQEGARHEASGERADLPSSPLPLAPRPPLGAYAERIAALIEEEGTTELLSRHPGLIGRFQEDVVVLRALPRATARLVGQVLGVRCQVSEIGCQGHLHPSPVTHHLSPLRLEDRPLLEHAAAAIETPLAAYAFAPHYVWRDLFTYTWAVIAGHFCLFAQYADGWFMPLPPLPLQGRREERDAREALSRAFALMRSRNNGSGVTRVENIARESVAQYERLGYRLRAQDPDYLYRAGDLAALAGDRYKSQRAACNRFERTTRHQLEAYTQGHREGCLALLEQWVAQKRRQGVDGLAEHLLRDAAPAHREALAHPEALGLTGRVVRVDGVVRAYSFEFDRSPSISCVLLEVADREIPGLAQFIFRETCRRALQRGVQFVNTMDDSGLLSLAQSK